ncbi:uncharacterized protein LOC126843639 [Adelges cooleyi]|uniref:uncharacterized protein LOC126843639 n=1 Tax=Adelges cooleyi TaxID=133065 RepID=UPI002180535B|nr:uncharacterized protein LOC126843639 [Adelges cooleyi]
MEAHPSLPSRMTVSSPPNNVGKSSFDVFATDYVNYAGVYACGKTPFGHSYSVTVLSRSKVLGKMYLDKMRNVIASANVSPRELSIVDHSNCSNLNENSRQMFKANNIWHAVDENIVNTIDDQKKVYISVQPKPTEEISGNPGAIWLPNGYL